jgi:hypothetical protein
MGSGTDMDTGGSEDAEMLPPVVIDGKMVTPGTALGIGVVIDTVGTALGR